MIGSTHVLHHSHGLLGLSDELILSLLNLFLRLRAELMVVMSGGGSSRQSPGGTLDARLDGVKVQTGLLDVLTGASSELEVGVESGIPSSEEAALDLRVLSEASLANALHG